MPTDAIDQHHDKAMLNLAIDTVFRKLIRFLMGRVSMVRFHEVIRQLVVEEAEFHLNQKYPGGGIPPNELASLAGLDPATVSEVRNYDGYNRHLDQKDRSFRIMLPENCVLEIWTTNSEFLDPQSGSPLVLPLRGNLASFESLVKQAIPSREVSSQSILASLVNNQAARLDKATQSVELLKKTPSPYTAGNQKGVFEIGMLQLCGLLDTIFYNYNVTIAGGTAFFDRGSWTHRLPLDNRLEFRERMRDFLVKADEASRLEMEKFEEDSYQKDQLTAGIFMYYFEEER